MSPLRHTNPFTPTTPPAPPTHQAAEAKTKRIDEAKRAAAYAAANPKPKHVVKFQLRLMDMALTSFNEPKQAALKAAVSATLSAGPDDVVVVASPGGVSGLGVTTANANVAITTASAEAAAAVTSGIKSGMVDPRAFGLNVVGGVEVEVVKPPPASNGLLELLKEDEEESQSMKDFVKVGSQQKNST